MSECMSEWINAWMNERMNESMNELINDWKNEHIDAETKEVIKWIDDHSLSDQMKNVILYEIQLACCDEREPAGHLLWNWIFGVLCKPPIAATGCFLTKLMFTHHNWANWINNRDF